MNSIKFFLTGYFNYSADNSELDCLIEKFKKEEPLTVQKILSNEIKQIIVCGAYVQLAFFIKQYGERIMRPHTAELFIKFLYNRLTDTPTEMTQLILRRIH